MRIAAARDDVLAILNNKANTGPSCFLSSGKENRVGASDLWRSLSDIPSSPALHVRGPTPG